MVSHLLAPTPTQSEVSGPPANGFTITKAPKGDLNVGLGGISDPHSTPLISSPPTVRFTHHVEEGSGAVTGEDVALLVTDPSTRDVVARGPRGSLGQSPEGGCPPAEGRRPPLPSPTFPLFPCLPGEVILFSSPGATRSTPGLGDRGKVALLVSLPVINPSRNHPLASVSFIWYPHHPAIASISFAPKTWSLGTQKGLGGRGIGEGGSCPWKFASLLIIKMPQSTPSLECTVPTIAPRPRVECPVEFTDPPAMPPHQTN